MTTQRQFDVDLYNLQHGGYVQTLPIDEALDRLCPAYYIDREKARQALRDGQALRTTGYEYRRADEEDEPIVLTPAQQTDLRERFAARFATRETEK